MSWLLMFPSVAIRVCFNSCFDESKRKINLKSKRVNFIHILEISISIKFKYSSQSMRNHWWDSIGEILLVRFHWWDSIYEILLVRFHWWDFIGEIPLVRFYWWDSIGEILLVRFYWWDFIGEIPLVRLHWWDSIGNIEN